MACPSRAPGARPEHNASCRRPHSGTPVQTALLGTRRSTMMSASTASTRPEHRHQPGRHPGVPGEEPDPTLVPTTNGSSACHDLSRGLGTGDRSSRARIVTRSRRRSIAAKNAFGGLNYTLGSPDGQHHRAARARRERRLKYRSTRRPPTSCSASRISGAHFKGELRLGPA